MWITRSLTGLDLFRGLSYNGITMAVLPVEAYCVKCRAKRNMKDGKEVAMPGKGGPRRAMTGLCEKCGTKMFRILGKK